MNVLLSLTVLFLTLAFAHGACMFAPLEVQMKDGKIVKPKGCADPFDKSLHPFGSQWNTQNCYRCSCREDGMECCTRYGGVVSVPGCKAVVDPETCKYVLYKVDKPTELCEIQI